MLEDFFKVLLGHMKVPPDHYKGPQATSKGHTHLPVAAMGKCKQANEFHYGHQIVNYSSAESAQFTIQGSPTSGDLHVRPGSGTFYHVF